MYNTTKIPPKKAVTVHDVSCFGRCAQTVIIPIMSALGVQVVPLPTALLSTHTGGFEGFTFLDLTDKMNAVENHWDSLGLTFDSVYTGFLGCEDQIENVAAFAKKCKANNPSCLFMADPVMGDDGEKYKTYTNSMCLLTRNLLLDADIITPNLTEACILTDTPYKRSFDERELITLLDKISLLTNADIVITGIHDKDSKNISTIYRKHGDKAFGKTSSPYIDANYPGTGDVFSSVVLSLLLGGCSFEAAIKAAGDFISLAADYTYACKTPIRDGLAIEAVLGELFKIKTQLLG